MTFGAWFPWIGRRVVSGTSDEATSKDISRDQWAGPANERVVLKFLDRKIEFATWARELGTEAAHLESRRSTGTLPRVNAHVHIHVLYSTCTLHGRALVDAACSPTWDSSRSSESRSSRVGGLSAAGRAQCSMFERRARYRYSLQSELPPRRRPRKRCWGVGLICLESWDPCPSRKTSAERHPRGWPKEE